MAAPIAVEWQVLLEDEAWAEGETVLFPLTRVPFPARSGRSPKEITGVFCLLLMLIGYALWNSRQVMATQANATAPALAAASSSGTLLTEHLRISARGPDVAMVAAISEELDALYTQIFSAVGVQPTHGADAPDG